VTQKTMVDLRGRVAIVAGGGGTIGGAIAQRLAESGASVVSADIAFLDEADPGIRHHPVDLTDAQAIRALIDSVVADHGRIDCLVCAAGVVSLGAFESVTIEEWDRVHSINLRGVFLLMQAAVAPMRKAGYGRIVTIGSVVAKNGGNARPWIDPSEQTNSSNAAYGSSKAGVHSLTLYLAKELATTGITVNAVAPGPVASRMTATFPAALKAQVPVGRLGHAGDIASAVAWLCAEESGFVTGEILDVNGGMVMD